MKMDIKERELHILASPEQISRYVFCPGSQERALKIASKFENCEKVSDSRGIDIYSGDYLGVPMVSAGTGMGGPATAIVLEELAMLGADTFIRVGSCGVLQKGQGPGDVIIASGTYRGGCTGNAYLPAAFPAVPTFDITLALVQAAEREGVSVRVGVGSASDAFYAPKSEMLQMLSNAHAVFLEMESDTLFVLGAVRGWRTGAIFASDGAPGQVKPSWGVDAFRDGEEKSIRIALEAMSAISKTDQ